MQPNHALALERYNEGTKAVETGDTDGAIQHWLQAISAGPPPGLEISIRHNLVVALTEDVRGQPRGYRLSTEQASRWEAAEQHLRRFRELCEGRGPEGPINDLDAGELAHFRNRAEEMMRQFTNLTARGYWILPNGETGRRMAAFGWAAADAREKDLAIEVLQQALEHIEPQSNRDAYIRSHFRLAVLLSDRGDRGDAARHARAALDGGLSPDYDQQLYMMAATIIQVAREQNATTEKAVDPVVGKSGCFIATAAYGTPMAPQVQQLRVYRDSVLSRSREGQLAITIYERISPPLARLVSRSTVARAATRCLLQWLVLPLVRFRQ